MARTPRQLAADLFAVLFCLLRLGVLWVVFTVYGVFVMLKKIRSRLKSKTYLANAAVIVAALSGLVPVFGPFLAPTVLAKAVAALGAANLVLREFTKEPLEAK